MRPYFSVFAPVDPATQGVSTALGGIAAIELCTGNPNGLTPARLREVVLPAIHQRRVRWVLDDASRPVAFAVWAMLADDVDASFQHLYGNRLHVSQWNEGRCLWILLAGALPGSAMALFLNLRRSLFREAGGVNYFQRPRGALPSQTQRTSGIRSTHFIDPRRIEDLGHILTLQALSPVHRDRSLGECIGDVTVTRATRRLKVFFGVEGRPAGYVIWQQRPAKTGRGGPVVRILEVVAPFGHLRHLLRRLLETEFQGCATVIYTRENRRHVRRFRHPSPPSQDA
ncbi:toxin-activating lysine-acyltransferase [Roseateles noduli]|uniref:toxin-activating lysine-acyltransferase n=1 Tax=Roseateles noduli TaxID=2052484 RepID=UPI003D65600D